MQTRRVVDLPFQDDAVGGSAGTSVVPPVHQRPVAELMRRRWISVAPRTPVAEAAQLMRLARVRHLPVLARGILLGTVAYPDLLLACADGPAAGRRGFRVRDVMSAGGAFAEPDTPLAEAVSRMVRSAVGCLPVVERTARGPRVLGLLTESDLLRAAYEPWTLSGSA